MNADIFALLFKVSAILVAAAVAALLLRNSSAARRHFVWHAAMTSVVVLVLLQLIVPPIVVPVAQHSPLAAFAYATTDDLTASAPVASHVVTGAPSAELETSREVLHAAPSSTLPSIVAPSNISRSTVSRSKVLQSTEAPPASGENATPTRASDISDAAQRANSISTAPSAVVASPDTPIALANSALSPDARLADTKSDMASATVPQAHGRTALPFQFTPLQVRSILLGAWLTGSLLLLLRLVIAHWQLRSVTRSAQVVAGPALYPDVDRIAMRLGIHKPVQLLVHECVTTPCTAGWRNPLILLPVSFAAWDETRQRAVFTHELAHVSRNDSLAQTVASLACVLFWFHPGFWMAARMLRGESERAADDCVINSGMAPVDYADHLIGIAEFSSSHSRVPAVALGMARSSQLELRLRAMLNARQSRSVITRGAQRVMGAAAFMAVVPFAGLQARVQEPQPAQPARPKPSVVAPVAPATKQPSATPASVVRPRTSSAAWLTVKPEAARFTLAIVPPMLGQNAIGLPVAPSIAGGPIRAPYLPALTARDAVPPPLPSSGVVTPALPARAVVAPPLPTSGVAAPSLSARRVVVPPLPTSSVAAPALPVRDVVVPPLPTTPAAAAAIAPPRVRPPELPVRADTTFERTLDAKPGDSLYVNIPAGGNVTVHGWDSNTAKLKASLGGKYWRETRVFFRAGKNGIQLFSAPEIDGASFGDGTSGGNSVKIMLLLPLNSGPYKPYIPTTVDNEFELWVPRKTHVKFASPIGALTLRDIDGDLDGSTKLGALDIANSYGKASLATENGDVRVASSALTGSVHTGCGALNVSNSSNTLAATTAFDPSPSKNPGQEDIVLIFSGTVHTQYCRLKPRMSTNPGVDERIPYGPIALDSAPNGGTLLTKSGDISLGSSGGVLVAQTSNANIDIRRMTGDITALNRNGNVDIRVVNTNSTVHNAWIRASAGTVTIELPDSIDAQVDIEVTYTEAYLAQFKRPARIRDDRSLPQTETAAWYRINSDPLRKAIRSKGTLGKGTGRIYIRVTDGDVVLKRAGA